MAPSALPDKVVGNKAGGEISQASTLDHDGQLGLGSPSWDHSSGFPQPQVPCCWCTMSERRTDIFVLFHSVRIYWVTINAQVISISLASIHQLWISLNIHGHRQTQVLLDGQY